MYSLLPVADGGSAEYNSILHLNTSFYNLHRAHAYSQCPLTRLRVHPTNHIAHVADTCLSARSEWFKPRADDPSCASVSTQLMYFANMPCTYEVFYASTPRIGDLICAAVPLTYDILCTRTPRTGARICAAVPPTYDVLCTRSPRTGALICAAVSLTYDVLCARAHRAQTIYLAPTPHT